MYFSSFNFDFDIFERLQIVTDALVNPPKPGEPSYELYAKEKAEVLSSLSRKATMVHERMNKITGIHCNKVQGAMYAFPRIDIPEEAREDAEVSILVCNIVGTI